MTRIFEQIIDKKRNDIKSMEVQMDQPAVSERGRDYLMRQIKACKEYIRELQKLQEEL